MKEYPFMKLRKIEVNLYCDNYLIILIIMIMTKEKLGMKNQKESYYGKIKIKFHNKKWLLKNNLTKIRI